MKKILNKELTQTISRLESVIGLDLSHGWHPLVGWLIAAKDNYDQENLWLCNTQVAYAAFAIRDMEQIRERNHELFLHFRREIRRNITPDNYFGLRQEIRTACSLLKKNIRFHKSEAPDFIIHGPLEIGVECTSAHLSLSRQPKSPDVTYKISSAIYNKSLKSYSTTELILVIDVGNLLYHEDPDSGVISNKDILRSAINDSIESGIFQSVLAFHYAFTPNGISGSPGIVSNYIRLDKGSISRLSKFFLDRHYPHGDFLMIGYPHKRV